MQTLTYSSNENSRLNVARSELFVAQYMKDAQEKKRGFYQFDFSNDPEKAKEKLWQVATQVRARLNSKKLYRVPLISGKVTSHATIPAFSAVNAQYRASIVAGDRIVGEPVCVG